MKQILAQISIKNKLIAIYGPTISEKTGLAINIARYIWGKYHLDSELISADPKKIYKELTVGPAAIFPRYQKKIPIHLFRFIDSLDTKFSLSDYKTLADQSISEIQQKNHLPIIYGGGAVWISSVLENWNLPGPGRQSPKYRYLIFIPKISNQALFQKIDDYTKRSLKLGINDELQKLVSKYQIDPLQPPTKHVLYQSLEYRQFLEYCYRYQKPLASLNKIDIEKIRRQSVKDLKDYARRQIRWIPKMAGDKYFVESWKEARKIVDRFLFC